MKPAVIDIVVHISIRPGFVDDEVKVRVQKQIAGFIGADTSPGQTVFESGLLVSILAVDGVEQAAITRLRRQSGGRDRASENGVIRMGTDEIPAIGTIEITIRRGQA